MGTDPSPPEAKAPPEGQRTWNTPEAIERHRRMTPEERWRATVELSRAALKFARAGATRDR